MPATDATLLDDLRRLVEPATMGDPTRPLLWVSKSWVKLATALQAMGHKVSANTVGKLLPHLGFTRHVNRKTKEGGDHPNRDGQFEYINAQAMAFHAAGQPVISVDTKKKELVGAYKNVGSDYRAEGRPDEVKVHDFVDKELGKVIPYGVYDIGANTGWINVGIDHDTAEFAVNTIRRWYEKMGRERYPKTDCLMITVPFGGLRRWRLQWHAGPAMESRAPKVRRQDRLDAPCSSLSARHIEVEQDRTSPVLPHLRFLYPWPKFGSLSVSICRRQRDVARY